MAYGLTQSAGVVAASDQFFTATDHASLSITGDFTVEAWVKFSSMPADRASIINKPNAAGNAYDAYALELNKNGANYDLRGLTDVSAATQTVTYASWNPSTSVWYHVAYTRTSATGVQKLIVDGVEVASATNTSGASNDSTSAVYLGRFGAGTALNLDGRLSLARVWNAVKTPTEINSDKCNVFGGVTTNMQAEWSLDNVLTDASGNAHTLTNNNVATFTTDVNTVCQSGGGQVMIF